MKRDHGEDYTTRKGKTVPAKRMKFTTKKDDTDDNTCKRFKCQEKFGEVELGVVFADYYSLSKIRKQDYLSSLIEDEVPSTVKREHANDPVRNFTRKFYLKYGERRERVCRKHFMQVFDINQSHIETALKNRRKSGLVKNKPAQTPANKTPDAVVKLVKDHIDSYPRVCSHYCRRDSQMEYLDPSLSVRKMHDMFVKKHGAAVSEYVYRETFNTEYNISFNNPAKDKCTKCKFFKDRGDHDGLANHKREKDLSREEKQRDKDMSKSEESVCALTFDLEKILEIPSSKHEDDFYYKKKFKMHNLTIYNLGNKDVICYLWTACNGKKGSIEIGTCLIKFIKSLPETIKHVILYSDCCAGQNRNQFVYTALLYALYSVPHIEVIEHKFLIPGHTQMECDTAHSNIEVAAHPLTIYTEHDWKNVILMARRKNPFKVVELQYTDFVDLKEMASNINTKVNRGGEKVLFTKQFHFKYVKNSDVVKYRASYQSHDFLEMPVRKPDTRNNPQQQQQVELESRAAYKEPFVIDASIKKDLLSLCTSGAIPMMYHAYYQNL